MSFASGCSLKPADPSSPDALFQARDFTPPGSFTSGVEGPAVDREGNVYAVNYERQHTIGRISPGGDGVVFLELPGGSVGNGIRFDRNGDMFIADYVNHNILRVDIGSGDVVSFAHEPAMNQPNDIAIAPNQRLYASDPDWSTDSGNLWRIDPDGSVTLLEQGMGTTNGIEVSPDGRRLYVNESVQRRVWIYDLSEDGEIANKRLFHQFRDHGLDGMRADVDGNLYITRYGKGTVVKMSPAGDLLQEVSLSGSNPSNVAFGGTDGRTAYVTVADRGNIETFRVDRPGRSWAELRQRAEVP
ncbi:MAG: SMP-30/gluconolactonase/LRE family protein [Bacteroidota bacterium]